MEQRYKVSSEELREIEEFLYVEARLADESRYGDWEELVEDDMLYWIPRGEGDYDINKHVSITADNRSRLKKRIAQLMTGSRYAQVPVSPMRRVISNIEARRTADDEFEVGCNFVLYELRVQSTNNIEIWPGRFEYRLRRTEAGLKMFVKKVLLINGDAPLRGLAFIL